MLLSGGTTGIGNATLRQLAAAGARVLTFARNAEKMEQAIDAIHDGDHRPIGIVADAGRREDIERVFAALDEQLGGVDIFIACAAVGADPIDEMAEDDWRYVVETNLVGYLSCSRAALIRMKAAGGGQILLVGSISSEIKAPGESVYSATKAGIQAFAETLRKEAAAQGVRVGVILPGATSSEMQEGSDEEQRRDVAEHRMLEAEQVADAILFAVTRADNCDVVSLRIEPRLQSTG